MRYVWIRQQLRIQTCLIQLAAFNLQIYVELIQVAQQIRNGRVWNLLGSHALWSCHLQAGQVHVCQLISILATAFIEVESQCLHRTCIVVQ